MTGIPKTTTRNPLLCHIISIQKSIIAIRFMLGEADIDAEWDNYVNAVMSYGYDEIAEAYQTAWTRYAEAAGK